MVAYQDNLNTNIINKISKTHYGRFHINFEGSNLRKENKLNIIDDGIDLNDIMTDFPESRFLIRVKGNSMTGAGINDGDLLLVDCIKSPSHNNIVVAAINNKIVVKRLHYSYKETMLLSENENYLPIRPKETDNFKIWGVAIMVIKDMK
ncbi:MAG: LexA family transcriptional regulator [Candidatus Kapabacteria bacterium]|nr:LexA family transcriptional regulator [Ignavibacteriota bacterium]MCW5884293.1 LexA family transcriptional regulator [Candidatus Kapabacteria bacterium]